MTRAEKYKEIKSMRSIEPHTKNEYPSKSDFFKALAEGRVSGDYDHRIVVVHNDANKSFTFNTK
jgi:hypothetical protein